MSRQQRYMVEAWRGGTCVAFHSTTVRYVHATVLGYLAVERPDLVHVVAMGHGQVAQVTSGGHWHWVGGPANAPLRASVERAQARA